MSKNFQVILTIKYQVLSNVIFQIVIKQHKLFKKVFQFLLKFEFNTLINQN